MTTRRQRQQMPPEPAYRKPRGPQLDTLCLRLRRGLRLTPGERLAQYRRAKGMSQNAAAAQRGVCRDIYREWEDDLGNVPVVAGVQVSDMPLRELCYVWRRRLGITLEELASVLGRSVSWVHLAEKGRAGAFEIVDYLTRRIGEETDDDG